MKNQVIHRTSKHEAKVDLKWFKERKEYTKTIENSEEKIIWIHSRAISICDDIECECEKGQCSQLASRFYHVSQCMKNGELEEKQIETNMNEKEQNEFKAEWKADFHTNIPIGQARTGIFKKLINF